MVLPLACDLSASSMEFLTGEKENQRSKSAKPTRAWLGLGSGLGLGLGLG